MRYLLYATKLYSIPILLPLAQLLSQKKRNWALYSWGKHQAEIFAALGAPQSFTNLKSAQTYQPQYVFSPENAVEHRLSGVKVQLFHGLGIEKASHFKLRGNYDVYLTSGPAVSERFRQIQARQPYIDIHETGWLKIDRIINYDTQSLYAKHQIPRGKKLILYAPTFSHKMQSATALAPLFPAIMREDEYWLFKFHPLMPAKLVAAFENLPASRIVSDADITPYLHLADVMITDTSSVLYEFYALDKPVITFRALVNPDKALNIIDPKALRDAIDQCLNQPELFKERREEAMQRVNPYLDGQIAQRTLDALDKIDPHSYPKAGKPFNPFRKLRQIRRSWKYRS